MTRIERNKYETLQKVQDFGAAHRELFPEGSKGEQALSSLADAMARIDAHLQARPIAANEGQKARSVAKAAVVEAMRKIARTARGIQLAPGQTRTLLLPRQTSGVAVINAARTFAREAAKVQHELVALGLPATCITDLEARIAVLVSTMQGRRFGSVDVAAAGGGTTAGFRQAFKALRTLDIVVGNAVAENAELSAAWARSREIVGASKAKAKGEAPVADAGDEPAGDAPADPLRKVS